MSRITTAMALAAGLGTRMRPLTLTRPKPLIEVAGARLLDRVANAAAAHGVTRMVVNMHWLADQIAAWAASRTPPPEILLSDERAALLDTGGGIAKALPLLGEEAPFFVFNTDSFLIEGARPALARLEAAWDDEATDCLVLLASLDGAVGYGGRGDFLLDASGRVRRVTTVDSADTAAASPAARTEREPHAFTGVYVVHPRLFAHAPARRAFSMNALFDVAMAAGRMYGIVHDGLWLHVGTPEAIAEAEKAVKSWRGNGETA